MNELYRPSRKLRLSPWAWLKWQYLCHAGPTEVAGFGLSAEHDLLYLEDILVIGQRATPATVAFDDAAVADHALGRGADAVVHLVAEDELRRRVVVRAGAHRLRCPPGTRARPAA